MPFLITCVDYAVFSTQLISLSFACRIPLVSVLICAHRIRRHVALQTFNRALLVYCYKVHKVSLYQLLHQYLVYATVQFACCSARTSVIVRASAQETRRQVCLAVQHTYQTMISTPTALQTAQLQRSFLPKHAVSFYFANEEVHHFTCIHQHLHCRSHNQT